MPFDVTRAYDEATQYADPRIWTAAARQARCGRRSKAEQPRSRTSVASQDATPIRVYDYRRAPTRTAPPRALPVVVVGAGPVGLAAAIDLAQRGMPVAGARRRRHGQRRLARDLLRQAHAGDLRPPGLRRARWRARACRLERRQGVLRRRAGLPVRPAARDRAIDRPAFVNLQQYYVEESWSSARGRCRRSTCAGSNKVVGVAQRRRPACALHDRDARRRLRARRATGSSPATARAARCATCSAWKRRARCSATAS